jgi:hypothetical protein
MRLDPDFREFIECCVAREVRFLIVGGYAVAVHGHPRSPKTSTCGCGWIRATPPNSWPPWPTSGSGRSVCQRRTSPIINVEHLIVNKRASGRPQDLADVAALESP